MTDHDMMESGSVTTTGIFVKHDHVIDRPADSITSDDFHFGPRCNSIIEAINEFVDGRPETVSVTKITFNKTGRLVSAEDITNDVIRELQDCIDAGAYPFCPHPLMQRAYDNFNRLEEIRVRTGIPTVRDSWLRNMPIARDTWLRNMDTRYSADESCAESGAPGT